MSKYYTPLLACLLLISCDPLAQDKLPVGSQPMAINYDYFPNKVFAVVWRNWNLVAPARIAKTLGCDVKAVNAIATSMGLKSSIKVPSYFKRRMYITIIRRNWHLLPYNQLLTLLDFSESELAVALKEDDFLYYKLGSLKPKCAEVAYSVPDKKSLIRAREIKQLIAQHFKDDIATKVQPRLSFVKQIASESNARQEITVPDFKTDELRFIYSYFGVFGDPLTDISLNPYPDGLLAKLASKGVNGVWMHVVLNQLAPGGGQFPEFGAGNARRLTNLRKIAANAKRYGIKIYLYMNEPRAMDSSFFKNRQDMAGVKEGDLVAMCTSNKVVTNWISNSLTYVFNQVPDLGGVFTITGSENLTNCASHQHQSGCPRCSKRSYADIITGINKTIEEGVHKGNANAKVIVYDWGWKEEEAASIIAGLPKNVWLMSVSEWGKEFERGGVTSRVGEYSMSVVGPGDKAKKHWELAKSAGLKTIAKVQFNNTWELSAVPWIPVPDMVAEHASNLTKENVDGFMLSWSLGGYPSQNLEIAQAFTQQPMATPEEVLNALAKKHYGKAAAPYIRKAWTAFSNAFRQFPFSINVVYKSPLQNGPANLLFANSTGYTSTMVGFPYDNLNNWVPPYPRTVFAAQFDKLVSGWKEGLQLFNEVLKIKMPGDKRIIQEGINIASACLLHFSSVANQAHFLIDRDSLLGKEFTAPQKQALKKKINDILDNEITLAKDLFTLTNLDSRIGFEASNQYYYVPQDLKEKVINCEFVRKQLIPEFHAAAPGEEK
jgi:hypothetical protein